MLEWHDDAYAALDLRVGDDPTPLAPATLASEQQLEDMIVSDPRMLSSEWTLLGRQEVTN